MTALTINGITKKFEGRGGSVTALDNIYLEVRTGEFVTLVGPSGCGKSTLLNILAGLDKPTSGEVRENGSLITKPGRDRSVVFQEGALFPWLTARKNVEFGLKQMGMRAKERADRADRFLHLVHLSRFADSFVHELSGGMRQRVAIARALAPDPEILLVTIFTSFCRKSGRTRAKPSFSSHITCGKQSVWQIASFCYQRVPAEFSR